MKVLDQRVSSNQRLIKTKIVKLSLKNKLSVQNFKFKNILIGDLMYDEYLRSKK